MAQAHAQTDIDFRKGEVELYSYNLIFFGRMRGHWSTKFQFLFPFLMVHSPYMPYLTQKSHSVRYSRRIGISSWNALVHDTRAQDGDAYDVVCLRDRRIRTISIRIINSYRNWRTIVPFSCRNEGKLIEAMEEARYWAIYTLINILQTSIHHNREYLRSRYICSSIPAQKNNSDRYLRILRFYVFPFSGSGHCCVDSEEICIDTGTEKTQNGGLNGFLNHWVVR